MTDIKCIYQTKYVTHSYFFHIWCRKERNGAKSLERNPFSFGPKNYSMICSFNAYAQSGMKGHIGV